MSILPEISSELRSILEEFSLALRGRYGDRYVGLWLYGSYARGDAHSESDIDLILILREVAKPSHEIDCSLT